MQKVTARATAGGGGLTSTRATSGPTTSTFDHGDDDPCPATEDDALSDIDSYPRSRDLQISRDVPTTTTTAAATTATSRRQLYPATSAQPHPDTHRKHHPDTHHHHQHHRTQAAGFRDNRRIDSAGDHGNANDYGNHKPSFTPFIDSVCRMVIGCHSLSAMLVILCGLGYAFKQI